MNITHQPRKYGWKPDLPDHRDLKFGIQRLAGPLPAKVDLHGTCPPVYDQGQLESCTANVLAAALDYERKRQNLPFLNPSRLFIYYNERVIENSVNTDSGAMLRDGMKSLASQGACAETLWPYQVLKYADQPLPACYAAALPHRIVQYSRLAQDVTTMKTCLAAGFPFVFGFTAYQSFESTVVALTGKLPMPGPAEPMLGGHAVVAVGYSDASQRFLLRNSWGGSWGINGYFTMPYQYVTSTNLCSDFWTIQQAA